MINDIFRPFMHAQLQRPANKSQDGGKPRKPCLPIYVDDLLVYSKTPEEHLEHLELVLRKLAEHKLYAKLPKCVFNRAELPYLGFIVGRDGVKVDPSKTAVIRDWPAPKNQKELQSVLGLANYFRKFVQGYFSMISILTSLTGAKAEWKWTPAHQVAFEMVKEALTSPPVLKLPDFDRPFTVMQGTGVLKRKARTAFTHCSPPSLPREM